MSNDERNDGSETRGDRERESIREQGRSGREDGEQTPVSKTRKQADQETRSPSRHQEASERSSTAILSEQSGQRFLKYIVGVFAAVAGGYGVGLLLFDAVADEFVGELALVALFVPVFGAPIISMVTGLMTGLRLEAGDQPAAVASAVGSFIGFFVMLILLVVFASIVVSNGDGAGGGDGLNDIFFEMAAFGLGVATTGAGTTFVVKRIGI